LDFIVLRVLDELTPRITQKNCQNYNQNSDLYIK